MIRYVRQSMAVPLSQGRVTWVCAEKYTATIKAGPWTAHKDRESNCYALRHILLGSGERKTQRLHQFLTGLDGVDHINGDGLNNCDYNLRPATPSQQQYNKGPRKGGSSKYKGVSRDKPSGKWRVQIAAEGVPSHYIGGQFEDELDAARAYDAVAIELHKEFAWLNCDHFGRANGSADELADYWHWKGRYEASD